MDIPEKAVKAHDFYCIQINLFRDACGEALNKFIDALTTDDPTHLSQDAFSTLLATQMGIYATLLAKSVKVLVADYKDEKADKIIDNLLKKFNEGVKEFIETDREKKDK